MPESAPSKKQDKLSPGVIMAVSGPPNTDHSIIGEAMEKEGWKIIDLLHGPRCFVAAILEVAGFDPHTIEAMLRGNLRNAHCSLIGQTPNELLNLVAVGFPKSYRAGPDGEGVSLWDIEGYEKAKAYLSEGRSVCVLHLQTVGQKALFAGSLGVWFEILKGDHNRSGLSSSLMFADREEMSSIRPGPLWPHVCSEDGVAIFLDRLSKISAANRQCFETLSVREQAADFISSCVIPSFFGVRSNAQHPQKEWKRPESGPVLLANEEADMDFITAGLREILASADMERLVRVLDSGASRKTGDKRGFSKNG